MAQDVNNVILFEVYPFACKGKFYRGGEDDAACDSVLEKTALLLNLNAGM